MKPIVIVIKRALSDLHAFLGTNVIELADICANVKYQIGIHKNFDSFFRIGIIIQHKESEPEKFL